MSITFTMCFNDLLCLKSRYFLYSYSPKGRKWQVRIFFLVFGGDDWKIVELTGGLMLSSFVDLVYGCWVLCYTEKRLMKSIFYLLIILLCSCGTFNKDKKIARKQKML